MLIKSDKIKTKRACCPLCLAPFLVEEKAPDVDICGKCIDDGNLTAALLDSAPIADEEAIDTTPAAACG